MPVQRVEVKGEAKQLVAFFDAGSNIHLIRKAFMDKAGWKGTPVKQSITTAGGGTKVWNSMEFWVPLSQD